MYNIGRQPYLVCIQPLGQRGLMSLSRNCLRNSSADWVFVFIRSKLFILIRTMSHSKDLQQMSGVITMSLFPKHFTNLSKQLNQKTVIKIWSMWWKSHNSVINMQWKCGHLVPVELGDSMSQGIVVKVIFQKLYLQTVLFVVQYRCLHLKLIVLIFPSISCHHICK